MKRDILIEAARRLRSESMEIRMRAEDERAMRRWAKEPVPKHGLPECKATVTATAA